MSRIGNKAIAIPAGVTIEVKDDRDCQRKEETLTTPLVDTTEISVEGNVVKVLSVPEEFASFEEGKISARHGLMRALLNNMVIGVSPGFVKELEFHGIGYKVDVRGKELVLNVGYSNPRIINRRRYQRRRWLKEQGSNIETSTVQIKSCLVKLHQKFVSIVRQIHTKEKAFATKVRVVRLKAPGKSK